MKLSHTVITLLVGLAVATPTKDLESPPSFETKDIHRVIDTTDGSLEERELFTMLMLLVIGGGIGGLVIDAISSSPVPLENKEAKIEKIDDKSVRIIDKKTGKGILIDSRVKDLLKIPGNKSSSECGNQSGKIECGGGQSFAELCLGRCVCDSQGDVWDPEGGKCKTWTGKVIWPLDSKSLA